MGEESYSSEKNLIYKKARSKTFVNIDGRVEVLDFAILSIETFLTSNLKIYISNGY